MKDADVEKLLGEILRDLEDPEKGKQMSDVEISVSSIRVSAKKLSQYSSKIENVMDYVNANLSKVDRKLFYFGAEITNNHSIVIEMQFQFDGNAERVTFHRPNKKEILKKAREVIGRVNDHNQVAVIFKEIRNIFRKRELTLVLDYKTPKCAEVRFRPYEKGDLKYTVDDDHLHLHREDIEHKNDDLGMSVPLADPGLLDPKKLENNIRSTVLRVADYNIAWMTAVREKVESESFFNSNWKRSADSVFRDPK